MARKEETLFRRLSRLFRSGPVVKRKIRALDTAIAVPDKTKSSGTLLFQKSLAPTYASITANAYNLSERLMRYQDFQEMEYTPELAAALDIYADEACAADDKGRSLHVYSDNEKIREVLDDLFYDTLNVEFNLRSWVRNLCKYGDMFIYNDVSPEHGIVNAYPIPVNEIEREENYDREDPSAVRFRWVSLGNRVLENWEVSHFRLLGNDMFLPYGSSIIEPARRIWRQLILIEDAMLVYRVVRAPERRVFYIDVMNIPPNDVPTYLEEQKKNLRSSQVIDRQTGRVDLRYNPLPVHKDTPVPMLDGSTLTIKELSEKMVMDPTWIPWVYSVQDGTKKIVPGKVVWCGKNYVANKLVKVWMENGTYVTTAPEHPFVMSNGSSKRADQLIVGDSIMSAYRDVNNKGYERIVEPSGELTSTHVMVSRDFYKEKWEKELRPVVHHRHPKLGSSNKRDNRPENLEVMDFWEHRNMHAKHCELTLNSPEQLVERAKKMAEWNKCDEHRQRTIEVNKRDDKARKMGAVYNGSELHASHNEIRREAQLKSWSESRNDRSEKMRWIIPNEVMSFVFDRIKSDPKIGREVLSKEIRVNGQLFARLKEANAHNERDVSKFHVNAVVSKLVRMGCISDASYNVFRDYAAKNKPPVNHQVARIENIFDASDDVYCMTVVGPRGEDDRHNFAVNGIGEELEPKSLILLLNSVDEDYFIPVRGSDTGTRIDTLAGGQNAAAVEDVAYIQKKLFAALKIPRAYLGYDDMLSSKATLCLVGNTKVPLLDGNTKTIEELANTQDLSNMWVYSCDPITGKIVPGKVKKAWKTKDVTEIHRVTLDSGDVFECTENHPFLCRDGTYKRADELQPGQSLMPLYRKSSISKKNNGNDLLDGYEMTLDNSTSEWKYTHKLVDEAVGFKSIGKARVIRINQWRSDYQRSIADKSPVGMRYVKKLVKQSGFESWRDFKRTLKYNHKVASVEIIKLSAPIPVYDLEVEKWHNFSVIGDKQGSVIVHNSQEDIRFSRTINVIQKTMIAELNKIAIIHLYANGFSGDDLVNFTLRLSNPSTVAQQQKLELWRAKFEIAGTIPEGMGSKRFVYKNVWLLNDDDIDDINNDRAKESAIDAAIEASATASGEETPGEGLFGAAGEEAPAEKPEETPPEEENAGEEPDEEEDSGVELLTASDVADDDDGFEIPSIKDDPPVKPTGQLKRALYNRSRRRTHGAWKTHIPDFVKMTGIDNQAMKDPYDNDWLKSVVTNPMGEQATPAVPRSMVKMLDRMSDRIGAARSGPNGGVLSEGTDVQDDIDALGEASQAYPEIVDEFAHDLRAEDIDVREEDDEDE